MPDFMITIIAFIILIGVLVFVHELGHFLAARWTGMRAEVFAVGMGPRLFGWNPITGFTFGKLPEDIELGDKTDYRISALPIGGYVKILGMVDESMDTDFEEKDPEPWEFRSKNTLQKAFVLSAGVIMNILLAIVIFAGVRLAQGEQLWATTTLGPVENSGAFAIAYEAGLREGDEVLSVHGEEVENFQEIRRLAYAHNTDEDIPITVERDGRAIDLVIERSAIPTDRQSERYGEFLLPDNVGIAVTSVLGVSAADKAGIEVGDTVVAMDGMPVGSIEDFTGYVTSNTGKEIAVEVRREGGRTATLTATPEEGKLGVGIAPAYFGPVESRSYSVDEALGAGVGAVWAHIALLGDLVNGLVQGQTNLGDNIGGPVAIAQAAGNFLSNGLLSFLTLMASLSVMLAVLNILPIPALDGGHLVFVLIEGITRREVPLKVRMAAQQVGFVVLLIFMVFVIYNDIAKL